MAEGCHVRYENYPSKGKAARVTHTCPCGAVVYDLIGRKEIMDFAKQQDFMVCCLACQREVGIPPSVLRRLTMSYPNQFWTTTDGERFDTYREADALPNLRWDGPNAFDR